MQGLSLVAVSRGHSSLWCTGLSLSRPLLLQSTGSRHAGSVVVAHGPSCSAACGIFPDQGSNPRPLHWQADSQPLRHQGSPNLFVLNHLFASYPSHCLLIQLPSWPVIWGVSFLQVPPPATSLSPSPSLLWNLPFTESHCSTVTNSLSFPSPINFLTKGNACYCQSDLLYPDIFL